MHVAHIPYQVIMPPRARAQNKHLVPGGGGSPGQAAPTQPQAPPAAATMAQQNAEEQPNVEEASVVEQPQQQQRRRRLMVSGATVLHTVSRALCFACSGSATHSPTAPLTMRAPHTNNTYPPTRLPAYPLSTRPSPLPHLPTFHSLRHRQHFFSENISENFRVACFVYTTPRLPLRSAPPCP